MLVQAYPSKEIDVETFIKESDDFNVKAITGAIVNKSLCVGYCGFNDHKGYLTESIAKEHKCQEKECVFFYRFHTNGKKQPNAKKQLEKQNAMELDYFVEQINSLGIDGFKVLSMQHKHTNNYDAVFASVGSIEEEKIKRLISKKIGIEVNLIRKEMSFDNIEKMFMSE